MVSCGVFGDVSACAHNINCQKCDMSQITITHHTGGAWGGDTPHYCQSYEQR